MYPFWLTLGFVIIAGLLARVAVLRRRQTRSLRELAAGRRLNFSAEDLIGIQDRYHNLDMIRQGHSRHACNVLYGPADVGLVTVFSYHYDLGFGTQQVSREWWFAVVETSGVHGHWRATPTDSSDLENATRIDRFVVRADHEATLQRLQEAGIEDVFNAAPPEYYWEVRGPLVAVAAPFDADPQTPRQLLDSARDLARTLARAGVSAPGRPL